MYHSDQEYILGGICLGVKAKIWKGSDMRNIFEGLGERFFSKVDNSKVPPTLGVISHTLRPNNAACGVAEVCVFLHYSSL